MGNSKLEKIHSENVHLFLAILRKKDNPTITSKDERCFKEVIYEDEETTLSILKARISKHRGNWRIHKTVNARSTVKAKKLLMHWMIDDLCSDARIESLYKKALLNKVCQAEKKFLIDVDSESETITTDIYGKILAWFIKNSKMEDPKVASICPWPLLGLRETPNGWHMIMPAFDVRILSEYENVEVKKDAYVFVERIEVK